MYMLHLLAQWYCKNWKSMKYYKSGEFDINRNIDLIDELPLWSAPFGLKLLDHIEYKKGITALDIGFGNGFPLTEIAMRLGDSAVVYGIDPWKIAIERVKRKIDFYGITNINIINGLAEDIPLGDNSVDLITSNNGINNVSDIGRVIVECSRIIKPDGQFIQTMNLDKSMIEFYNVFEEVLSGMKMYSEVELMHRHIARKRPPLDGMISEIKRQGFTVNDVIYDSFNYMFTDGTSMLNHYFIRMAFMNAWMELVPADRAEDIFNEVELKLNHKAETEGGLSLGIPFVMIDARAS
jgi:arsenite methyltransferase